MEGSAHIRLYLALTPFVHKRIDTTFLVKGKLWRKPHIGFMKYTRQIWNIPCGRNLTSHVSTKVVRSFQHSLVASNITHRAVIDAEDSVKKGCAQPEDRETGPEHVKSLGT